MKENKIIFPFGAKIFLIVISLLIIITSIAIYSSIKISRVNHEVEYLSEYIIPLTTNIGKVDAHVLRQELSLARIFKLYEMNDIDIVNINKEKTDFENMGILIDRNIEETLSIVSMAIKKSKTQMDKEEFTQLLPQITEIENEHQDFHDHALLILKELKSEGNTDTNLLELKLEEEKLDFDSAIKNIYNELIIYREQVTMDSERNQEKILKLNISLTIFAIFASIIIAFLFTMSLTKPIKNLIIAIRAIGKGDFEKEITVKSKDEIKKLAISFEHMRNEMVLKEKIKSTFGKYVDQRIVENLINDKSIETGGEKREMTVIFSSILGFDTIIKKFNAKEQIYLINSYLSLFSKTFSEENGVIDKYIDTTIMGFWGEPFCNQKDHAYLACRSIIKQKEILPQLFTLLENQNIDFDKKKLVLCSGIATGNLVIGNMGSEQSKSYTVLGDTVNISSRLKGASKQYGVSNLINDRTRSLISDRIVSREIDLIKVVGKYEPIRIHEVLAEVEDSNISIMNLKENYEQGLLEYRNKNWEDALIYFRKCNKIVKDDGPSFFKISQIKELIIEQLSPDWDGVTSLLVK